MPIILSENIQTALSNFRLYSINFQCVVEDSNPGLWEEIDRFTQELKTYLSLDKVNKIEKIEAARIAYKKCGKDPNRYRPSADSLIRRIVKGNNLYKINNVVDVLNYISIQSGFSIGGYDTDKIQGEVFMDIGTSADNYIGIGRGDLNIEGLPVLRDDVGVFGSPTSDSERTMITKNTKNCSFIFFDFGVSDNLPEFIDKTVSYLKDYANCSNNMEFVISK